LTCGLISFSCGQVKGLWLVFFSIAVSITSCQPEGRTYVKHQTLSADLAWMKEDVKSFEIPIEDTSKVYAMSLAYRYANGYQFDRLVVHLTEKSPSGVVTENERTIKIRDVAGNYIGEPGYDIWDCEEIIDTPKRFDEKGNYSYQISHKMPQDQLHFGMEIGLILDEL